MKQILGLDTGTVTFTPGAAGAGTLAFSSVVGFNPARVLGITNITRKSLIYAAEVTGKAGAWSSLSSTGGTLTLDADTAAHNAADVLRCLYETADAQLVEAGTLTISAPKANYAPEFTSSQWTKSAQVTTWTNDYGDGPLPGSRSTLMVNSMSPDNIGANYEIPLNGRCDGRYFVASMYARGSGTLLFTLTASDATNSLGTVDAASRQLVLTSAWQRVTVPLLCTLSDPVKLYIRIKAPPGPAVTAEMACLTLEADVDGPSRWIEPVDFDGTRPIISWNQDRTSIIAWGDSMVNGVVTGAWRTQLSHLLNGSPVTNKGVGGETTSQILTRMSAATWLELHQGVVVIWAGRNNFLDPTTVLADIESMVALVPHGRFLILAICNQTTETIGSGNHTAIKALNQRLAIRYGKRFVDVRKVLCRGSTADSPRSIWMADATHPNAAGNGLIAQALRDAIVKNGFLDNINHNVGGDEPTFPWSYSGVISSATTTNVLPAIAERWARVKSWQFVNTNATGTDWIIRDTAGVTLWSAKAMNGTLIPCNIVPAEPLWASAPGLGIDVVTTAAGNVHSSLQGDVVGVS